MSDFAEINRHSILDSIAREKTDEIAYFKEQLAVQQQEHYKKMSIMHQLLKEETNKLLELKKILTTTTETHRTGNF
jgi:hypothetical protein